MHRPIKFSIVCAAFNAAPTIVRAIESCLAQTLPPHEVIVVDDGSTDDTVKLLESTFGNRIHVICLPENRGPSKARNCGLDAATGDFIALQDADDWWHPHKLEMVEAALGKTNGNFLFHNYANQAENIEANPRIIEWPLWKLLLRNRIATPCSIFVNDAAIRFDDRLRRMEDWDFFLQLTQKWGALFLDAPLTQLGRPVLSPGGLSSSRSKMRLAEMRVLWKWTINNPRYIFLLPFLWLWSLAKAVAKKVRRIL